MSLLATVMWICGKGIESHESLCHDKTLFGAKGTSHYGKPLHLSKRATRWFDLRIEPVPEGVFILSLDITERKKAEEELRPIPELHLEKLVGERTAQLKDAERLAAIGATAGMVGHDIRNPLQAITSDVYLAKTELASVP